MIKVVLPTVVLLLLGLSSVARRDCSEGEMIHCERNDRCTRIRYICDGGNDCGDNSDEDRALCKIWEQHDCSRGYAMCYRYESSNCVRMNQYCTTTDPPCKGDVDPRICQMLKDNTLQDVNSIIVRTEANVTGLHADTEVEKAEALGHEFEAQVAGTIKHESCPQMYTSVAGSCISLFFLGNITWGEAREFCKTIDGDLLTLDRDYDFYTTLVKHIKEQQITADFWVGGNQYNETTGWNWITGTAMDLAAPIWAVRSEETCITRVVKSLVHINATRLANQGRCYQYSQAPAHPPRGHCAALTFDKFYYMTDEDCLERKAPLCIINTELNVV